ncbi:MAG: hypothetical protein KC452_07995 [Kurthia sp.]|nr:hypothetical protein [Kurthia sp.]
MKEALDGFANGNMNRNIIKSDQIMRLLRSRLTTAIAPITNAAINKTIPKNTTMKDCLIPIKIIIMLKKVNSNDKRE